MPFSHGPENHVPLLVDSAVHVWHIPLVVPSPILKSLYQILSSDEQLRTDNLRLQTLKNSFIAGRGILRKILGRYLQTDPAMLVFSEETSGKPHLEDKASCLNFNMSHSGGLSLFAVSLGRAVGIDLEKIRPVNNLTSLTNRFFSPDEHSYITSLPPDERENAFFKAWVLKEAYVKATGEGLVGMDKLELFHTDTGRFPAPLIIKSRPRQSSREWSALSFEPSPSHVAALVAEGNHFSPYCLFFNS
jgi:4'-phosphopantetheinyl transferase